MSCVWVTWTPISLMWPWVWNMHITLSHIENKEQSRKEYTKDKMKVNNEHKVIVSADMQKVMLLLYMTGNKLCAFTSRLVCFHCTFAPLDYQKQKTGKQQVWAVLWHEAIAERSAAEVTSVFVMTLGDLVGDAPNVVIRTTVLRKIKTCIVLPLWWEF